jgi:hypothetical protein
MTSWRCLGVTVCVLLVGRTSSVGAEQSTEGPRLEAAVSLVGRASSNALPGVSPRATWNISDRTAIEGFIDIGSKGPAGSRYHPGRIMLFGQFKRTVLEADAGDLFIVVGVHRSYQLRSSGGFTLRTPDGRVLIRRVSRLRQHWWSGMSIGGGYSVPIGTRLTFRADAQFGTTQDGPLWRTSLGAGVPLLLRKRSISSPAAQPPGPRPRSVSPIVWVTMFDGRELKARLKASDGKTIELSQADGEVSVLLSDVWRLESPDSLANGAGWGALIGGVGFALQASAAFAFSSDVDLDAVPGAALMLGGIGAGLGALGGLMVDSLIEGRRVIYSAAKPVTVTIDPLVSSNGTGVSARVRW